MWVQFMSSVYICGDTIITGIEIWAVVFFCFFFFGHSRGSWEKPVTTSEIQLFADIVK